MNLAHVLTDVLLPIFMIFSVGFILGRKKSPEPRSIAQVSIYILLPALVFTSFLDKDVLSSLAITGVYVAVFTGIMYMVSVVVCKLLKFDRKLESAFLLSVLFTNSGNYGVPFCAFAFGEEGMVNALVYMMYSSIIIYTVAVYFASRGNSSMKESLANIFKVPLIYVVVTASVFSYFSFEVPSFIVTPFKLLGSAAIPVTMLLLGIQLSRTGIHDAYKPIVLSNMLKLAISPVVGLVITHYMGVGGLLQSVLIIESSMPTAVNSALIAVEFDAEPGFVSSTVLTSTLLSIFSLTALLLYLT